MPNLDDNDLDRRRVGNREPRRMTAVAGLVPLAGIEPALLAELDFESSASTSSATGAIAADRRDKPGTSEAGGL